MNKMHRSLFAMLPVILVIFACNFPSATQDAQGQSAAMTAAAQTIQAQLPASATAAPTMTDTPNAAPQATNTPISTVALPTATSNCDAAQFVTDVTIPDDTIMTPGQTFTKTWRLKNTGTCSWTTAYAVVFVSGTSMNGPATQALTGNVNPGQTVDISVSLTAPTTPGTYTGTYNLRNGAGVMLFNSGFYVRIKVQNSSGGDGGSSGPFAVTGVTYTLTTFDQPGYVGCPKVTAHITANGEGDVTYRWTRSDNASSPTESIHFNSAGTKNVSKTWTLGSVWAGGDPEWLGIYIDSPNHQDFGHINVNACTSP